MPSTCIINIKSNCNWAFGRGPINWKAYLEGSARTRSWNWWTALVRVESDRGQHRHVRWLANWTSRKIGSHHWSISKSNWVGLIHWVIKSELWARSWESIIDQIVRGPRHLLYSTCTVAICSKRVHAITDCWGLLVQSWTRGTVSISS